VDEVIQYLYTLLASIPDVLLIAASVLLLQVFIDKNQGFFETALERSDARLFFLCLILGVTSFTGLCRLVRGETLKLRELEYIQSARAMGVSTPHILRRHIVPNLMHLVLINTVMQFSGFVLAEAVLSYVGVGVDPKTASFGVMINTARAELAATPIVWWTLATAFVFMLLIVLSANLLADAVRDAFDPRTRLRAGASTPPVSPSASTSAQPA
jgi:peptide/nickel transport system permease protein